MSEQRKAKQEGATAPVVYVFEAWENPLSVEDQIRAAYRAKALGVKA